MSVRHCMALITLWLLACSPHGDRFYAWNDQRVLCSTPIDDLTGTAIDWGRIRAMLEIAHELDRVALLHAHAPDVSVSRATLERVLDEADAYHLDYVTYDELRGDRQQRAGLALSFDDDSVDGWYELRDLLFAHRARVTFFVSNWDIIGEPQRMKLAQLVRDGHRIEPHGAHHVNAVDYTHAHGLATYLADEIMPSIEALRAAGYHPTTFAYPFGAHDTDIDAALLEHVERVRTTPGGCPVMKSR